MREYIPHECRSRRLHITPMGFEDTSGNVFNYFRAKFIAAVSFPTEKRVELSFTHNGEDFCLELDTTSRDGRHVECAFHCVDKPCDREYMLYATPSELIVALLRESGEERIIFGYSPGADPSESGYMCTLNASIEEPYYGPGENPYDDGSDPSM